MTFGVIFISESRMDGPGEIFLGLVKNPTFVSWSIGCFGISVDFREAHMVLLLTRHANNDDSGA